MERSRFSGRIGVVGAGRLGSALAMALTSCGYHVDNIASRDSSRAEALAARLEGTRSVATASLVKTADLVILAVPDGAIETLARSLAWRIGQAVVHCSGALDLAPLATAAAAGALTGCFHPLQSFASADGAARFEGVTCGVEGAEPLGGWLETMASDLGGHPLRLEGVNRALYHAAAVLASNDVVALMAAAERTWAAAGLAPETARSALAPLLLGAASNIAERPLAEALTGPVARGDVETVGRHLEALAPTPELAALYRVLGRELLRLPLAIDRDARARLEGLFGGDGS